MLPVNFYALARRYHELERIQFLCSGIIVANVRNMFLTEGADPISPWDFVPGGEPQDIDDEASDDDPEGAALRMQAWAIAWNAQIARAKAAQN